MNNGKASRNNLGFAMQATLVSLRCSSVRLTYSKAKSSQPFSPKTNNLLSTFRSHLHASLPQDISSQFPAPGTTSILLRIFDCNSEKARSWLSEWLQDFLFSAKGTFSAPLSTGVNNSNPLLLFYASTGDVRGVMIFSVERDRRYKYATIIRVTSSSRFLNPSGAVSATLPGERRILRTLVSSLDKSFPGKVFIIYKPPYVRLKRSRVATEGDDAILVTVLVGEVKTRRGYGGVVDFLHSWGSRAQFGAGLGKGVLGIGRIPPISTEAISDGIRIRIKLASNEEKSCELLLRVREKRKGRDLFKEEYQNEDKPEVVSKSVLVIGSSTRPNSSDTRILLKR